MPTPSRIVGLALLVVGPLVQLTAYDLSYLTDENPASCLLLPTSFCRAVLASGYARMLEIVGLGAIIPGRIQAQVTPLLSIVALSGTIAGLVLLVRTRKKE